MKAWKVGLASIAALGIWAGISQPGEQSEAETFMASLTFPADAEAQCEQWITMRWGHTHGSDMSATGHDMYEWRLTTIGTSIDDDAQAMLDAVEVATTEAESSAAIVSMDTACGVVPS